MSVVQVTTATEFRNAVTNSENIVEVMNDIDFQNSPFTANLIINATEVNGNGHTLFNVTDTRDANANACFQFGTGSIYFHDISIANVLIPNENESLFYITSGSRTGQINIENIDVQGMASTLIYNSYSNSTNIPKITKCIFSMHNVRQIHRGGYSQIEYCYFNCDYSNNGEDIIYFQNASYGYLKNCLFQGNFNYVGTNTGVVFFIHNTPASNNVYNLNWNSTVSRTIRFSVNTSNVSLINISNVGSNVTIDSAYLANIIRLTDTQIKSADYISQNTSFPIIV